MTRAQKPGASRGAASPNRRLTFEYQDGHAFAGKLVGYTGTDRTAADDDDVRGSLYRPSCFPDVSSSPR
jgi:hypothetical protein